MPLVIADERVFTNPREQGVNRGYGTTWMVQMSPVR